MLHPIDQVFQEKSMLKIMTHVVAGYPDFETCKEIVRTMAESGADLIEIQIPFSDPLADGPLIMNANQKALETGMTPAKCFVFAEELAAAVKTPLLLMTYANIPFRMGIDTFLAKSEAAGIRGVIIPDLPYDEENDDFFEKALQSKVYPIVVVSPGMKEERLQAAVEWSRGFVYSTLKIGITGEVKEIKRQGINWIDEIRKHTSLPVACGFGISSLEHVSLLKGKAEAVVIGSLLLNLFDRGGLASIGKFIRSIPRTDTLLK